MPSPIWLLVLFATPAAALHARSRGRLVDAEPGWQPGHGQITRLPGCNEPLKSRCAARAISHRPPLAPAPGCRGLPGATCTPHVPAVCMPVLWPHGRSVLLPG